MPDAGSLSKVKRGLPVVPKGGERCYGVKKLVVVDQVDHFKPLLADSVGMKGSGNGATNGSYRIGVSADVCRQQGGLPRRLRNQSQADGQRNNVLRLVGEVLACDLICDQMLPLREI